MDLAVFVKGDNSHDGSSGIVPRKQQRTGVHPIWISGISQARPSEPVVVLSVQICWEVDPVIHVGRHTKARASLEGRCIRRR